VAEAGRGPCVHARRRGAGARQPTASIDAEAEHELFERFRTLAEDRTAIVISHRFSTVRIADRIAVLHAGRLEELGTHRELLEKGGRYSHLFTLQAQGYL
jgi:ATP-binding cassette subfamily B protein/ATP-binding cassette subfamily C protein